MKYLKRYESIKSISETNYLTIDDKILNIVSDYLSSINIYEKSQLFKIMDNSLSDIEDIWLDVRDEFYDSLDIKISKSNSTSNNGYNLSNLTSNCLIVTINAKYDLGIHTKEQKTILNTNNRCLKIENIKLNSFNSIDPSLFMLAPYKILVYEYEYSECVNFWEKITYNREKTSKEESICVGLYNYKFGSEVFPISWDKTIIVKDNILLNIRPKLFELGIAPICSYGMSAGARGNYEFIDIKFVKLKEKDY